MAALAVAQQDMRRQCPRIVKISFMQAVSSAATASASGGANARMRTVLLQVHVKAAAALVRDGERGEEQARAGHAGLRARLPLTLP